MGQRLCFPEKLSQHRKPTATEAGRSEGPYLWDTDLGPQDRAWSGCTLPSRQSPRSPCYEITRAAAQSRSCSQGRLMLSGSARRNQSKHLLDHPAPTFC